MALDIVYGYQGKDHVKASQLARLLSGTIGEGRYVLGTQNEMAASMQTANKVRISTGDLVMDGRYITNEAYQDLTVDSGQSGYNRNDLVGVQYSRASGSDADHAVETVSLVVKKGTQTTGTATDPSYTAGDIAAGDASAFYPLWRLPINGLTVGTPVQLFNKAPSVADLRETISRKWASESWSVYQLNERLAVAVLKANMNISAQTGWGSVYYSTFSMNVPNVFATVIDAGCKVETGSGIWSTQVFGVTNTKFDYYIINPVQNNGVWTDVVYWVLGELA